MALQLLETQDGSHTLLSETYGVSYHSRYGAIQESRHVFIEAGPEKFIPRNGGKNSNFSEVRT